MRSCRQANAYLSFENLFIFVSLSILTCFVQLHIGMSKEGLARGIGPFKPVAGRAWANDFMSRKKAGLAGEACRGTGPKAGKPTVIRGFLHFPQP